MSDTPITGNDTIATWLEHPVGHDLVIALLGGPETSAEVIPKVRNLPLNTLSRTSQGRLPQEAVDAVVAQANGGVMPEIADPAAAGGRFAGKTVIVTGAASGIGRATAERIVAEGAVVAVAGDITRQDDVARVIAAAGDTIDGLANVAGIMNGMLPLHEVSDEVWDRVIAVNLTGTFKLSRAVTERMLEHGRGTVVNVASVAAIRGNAAGTAYTTPSMRSSASPRARRSSMDRAASARMR